MTVELSTKNVTVLQVEELKVNGKYLRLPLELTLTSPSSIPCKDPGTWNCQEERSDKDLVLLTTQMPVVLFVAIVH